MNAVKYSGGWGVPLAKPRVALSATSPRADYRAAGFALQSLTLGRRAEVNHVRLLAAAIVMLVLGCSPNVESTDNSITEDLDTIVGTERETKQPGVGGIHLGMSLAQAKGQYPEATFREVPVFEYGVDGEESGVLFEVHGSPLLFVYTQEESDAIAGISVLSPTLSVGKNIRTGMTAMEFLEQYPQAQFEIDVIDEGIEFGYVKDEAFRVEFLTTDSTRVGQYEASGDEPRFIKVSRPDARIDRIMI